MAACLRALRPRVWIGLRFDGAEPTAEHLFVDQAPPPHPGAMFTDGALIHFVRVAQVC